MLAAYIALAAEITYIVKKQTNNKEEVMSLYDAC